MVFLRSVKGATRLDRVKSNDVIRSLRQKLVLDMVKEKQRRWNVRMEEMK